MFTLNKTAALASLATFVVLGLGFSARAEEPVQNLGPVPAHVPILTSFGNKGVIAFYEPDGAHCGLYAIVYNRDDESGASGVRVRLSLDSGQVVNFDSPDTNSLSLKCGDSAEALTIVGSDDVATNWPEE